MDSYFYSDEYIINCSISYLEVCKDELGEIFSQNKEDISFTLYCIGQILYEIDFYSKREWLDFRIIEDMLEYMLDSNFDSDSMVFGINLLYQYLDVICSKSYINEENYNLLYKKFLDNLRKKEEFFYTNIYIPTYEYDDVIVKITNILEGGNNG